MFSSAVSPLREGTSQGDAQLPLFGCWEFLKIKCKKLFCVPNAKAKHYDLRLPIYVVGTVPLFDILVLVLIFFVIKNF